jgi:hypothetical protein
MLRSLLAAAFVAALFLAPGVGGAATQDGGVVVLEGRFGSLGSPVYLDITARLRELCVRGAERCEVFCSETSFGRYALGKRPICRVLYRCPDRSTRSAEAAREEPIFLRCDASELGAAGEDRATAAAIR